jgi:hypothetical protein
MPLPHLELQSLHSFHSDQPPLTVNSDEKESKLVRIEWMQQKNKSAKRRKQELQLIVSTRTVKPANVIATIFHSSLHFNWKLIGRGVGVERERKMDDEA